MNVDLDITIPFHMDISMMAYFLLIYNLSQDYWTAMKSKWKTDIMDGSTDDC
jgi:hypothetical protein